MSAKHRRSKKKNVNAETALEQIEQLSAAETEAVSDIQAADESVAEQQKKNTLAAEAKPNSAVQAGQNTEASPEQTAVSEKNADADSKPIPANKKDGPLRSTEPVRTVTPADIRKPQVSFMNSIANVEPESLVQRRNGVSQTAQAYDHAVMAGDEPGTYQPMIRRMSDSTRARELRRRQTSGDQMLYRKVTPDDKPQTLPASKLRKRRETQVTPEVLERIPDNLKAHPLEEAQPVAYIRQAEHTQIDLSASNEADRSDIDIDVRYPDERRERTDLPKEAKGYSKKEDQQGILNDLLELKTNLLVRVAMLGLLTVCSGLLTLFDWLPGFPMPAFLASAQSPVAYLTIQLLLGLAALPFCAGLLKNGYLKLLQLRADCDSLAAMSMMSAELAAFLILPSAGMLQSGVVSVYISTGLLALFLNAIGKMLIASRALRNFERLADGNPKYGIHYIEDERRAENLTRGTTGDFPIVAVMQPVENPQDFLKYTFSTDIADKFCRTAVPVIMLIAILFSVGMSVIRAEHIESTVCYGMSIFALCFSACACTAITLISNLPMASGTKDYVRNSGMLLGYQSVDDFFDVNTVMVDARMLFPRGTTKLESIQVIGEGRIEEALQYAASLTQHANSILKDLFANAILAEDTMLLPVENYVYDEGKGISGWIRNKRVLLGTRDMMIEHSVEGIPPHAKVKALVKNGSEPLYLSVAGSVSALYIVHLEAGKSVRHWLRELEHEDLFLLVRSNDAMLSQRRIAKMFGIREEHLKVLPARMEQDFAEETVPLESAAPSMLCAGRLAGFVQTIIGAKRIRAAATLGMILQAVTACLGLLFAILFIVLGAYSDLTGGILLIYHLICTVVTILSVRMKDT